MELDIQKTSPAKALFVVSATAAGLTALTTIMLRATGMSRIGSLSIPQGTSKVLAGASILGLAAATLGFAAMERSVPKDQQSSMSKELSSSSDGSMTSKPSSVSGEAGLEHEPAAWRGRLRRNGCEARIEIANQTLAAVDAGWHGTQPIPVTEATPRQRIDLTYDRNMALTNRALVVNGDIVEVSIILKQRGYNPMLMNMANSSEIGGGFLRGAGAEEEYLCRISNYYRSLEAFEHQAGTAGQKYDLHDRWGVLYTPDVTFFRGTEADGYPVLKEPVKLAVGAVAAYLLTYYAEQLSPPIADATRQKIAAYVAKGIEKGHDCIVIGALGCGAFQNPPDHIAELCLDVLSSDQFKDAGLTIVFAIFNDHNTRAGGPGNVQPFADRFTRGKILRVDEL